MEIGMIVEIGERRGAKTVPTGNFGRILATGLRGSTYSSRYDHVQIERVDRDGNAISRPSSGQPWIYKLASRDLISIADFDARREELRRMEETREMQVRAMQAFEDEVKAVLLRRGFSEETISRFISIRVTWDRENDKPLLYMLSFRTEAASWLKSLLALEV